MEAIHLFWPRDIVMIAYDFL